MNTETQAASTTATTLTECRTCRRRTEQRITTRERVCTVCGTRINLMWRPL